MRVLWADAICINQQDVHERNSQVLMMRHIYEGAEQKLMWLGEDTGNAQQAFEVLQDLEPYLSQPELDIANTLNLIESESENALGKLLGRSWFLRVWVVQETSCAGRATVVCGKHSMDWKVFLEVAESFNSFKRAIFLV